MHHTNDKGDIGVARATAEFLERGFDVFIPVSSTSPFDLLIYKDTDIQRVQVKYRKLNEKGWFRVDCDRASIGAGKIVKVKNEEVDLVCVFNPDTNKCYFVNPKRCPLKLRNRPTNNNQQQRINWLHDFTELPNNDGNK